MKENKKTQQIKQFWFIFLTVFFFNKQRKFKVPNVKLTEELWSLLLHESHSSLNTLILLHFYFKIPLLQPISTSSLFST